MLTHNKLFSRVTMEEIITKKGSRDTTEEIITKD